MIYKPNYLVIFRQTRRPKKGYLLESIIDKRKLCSQNVRCFTKVSQIPLKILSEFNRNFQFSTENFVCFDFCFDLRDKVIER